MDPSKFIELLLQQAQKAQMCYRLGAVVLRRGDVLGTGYNKPHGVFPPKKNHRLSIHAEMDAIKFIHQQELFGADMIVLRINPQGQPLLACPCQKCIGLLTRKGLKRIFYSTEKSWGKVIL